MKAFLTRLWREEEGAGSGRICVVAGAAHSLAAAASLGGCLAIGRLKTFSQTQFQIFNSAWVVAGGDAGVSCVGGGLRGENFRVRKTA